MKPLTEDLAAVAAPATAAPELLPHTWNNGDCENPELVTVDFGRKGGAREAVVLLGLCADGTWRYGYAGATKGGERFAESCRQAGGDYTSRQAALRCGLGQLMKKFEGDKPAAQTLAAFFGRTLGAAGEASSPRLPANTGTASSAPLPAAEPRELPVAAIQRNPEQPRRDFPAVEEQDLADSIASVGLLQRIVVRRLLPDELGELPGLDGERYEIVAGERRWRAHQRLGRETIKCEVLTGVTRAQAYAAALVENLQREGLNPIEEAEGFRALMLKEGLTQEQCAGRVAKSRSVVANALRVLDLPEKAVGYIREGKLTTAHGVALARFKDWPAIVVAMADYAVKAQTPASELEQGVPFINELIGDELVAHVRNQDFGGWNGEIPAAVKKHPSLMKDQYQTVLLDVAFYREQVAAFKAEEKAAAEAAAERERKKAEKAAKNPEKIKNLADLPRASYATVTSDNKELLALVPDEATRELKEDGQTVTICTKPDFYNRITKEVNELKAEDRKAKWAGLVKTALAKVHGLKKLGARELTLLVVALSRGEDLYPGPQFTKRGLESAGVKLPKKAIEEHYENQALFETPALLLLEAQIGPLDLFRALMDGWLRELEDDLMDGGYSAGSDSTLGTVVACVLGVEELGFLEETKAGQKEIMEAIKAREWYQRGLAEIEGREYVAPPAPKVEEKTEDKKKSSTAAKPAKAKKVGGRAVITNEIYAEVKKLVQAGRTGSEISTALGISLPSVQNCKKWLGLVGRTA